MTVVESPEPVDPPAGRDALLAAAADIDRARRELDRHAQAGVRAARGHLERAVARLEPLAAYDGLAPDARRAAERCRATLASYLLAVDNLETAGVAPETVAGMLRRGTDAGELAAAAT